MTVFKNRNFLLLLTCIFFFVSACDKDDDEPDNTNNNSSQNPDTSGDGGADVAITGDLSEDLGDYATWEITDDQLLRIRIGSEFPDNLVLNYRYTSGGLDDFEAGTYMPVSATFTGQPEDEIAFQYNGDDPWFPDDGTVTITEVSGNTIEGELDVTMSTLDGNTAEMTGSFTAEPLE